MVLKEVLFPLRIVLCTTSLELDFGTLPISIGEVLAILRSFEDESVVDFLVCRC